MNYEQVRIRKLQLDEDMKSFDCGDADLNESILKEAFLYRKALFAVTYVLEDIPLRRNIGSFQFGERPCFIE